MSIGALHAESVSATLLFVESESADGGIILGEFGISGDIDIVVRASLGAMDSGEPSSDRITLQVLAAFCSLSSW